jgi:hypothetical protein
LGLVDGVFDVGNEIAALEDRQAERLRERPGADLVPPLPHLLGQRADETEAALCAGFGKLRVLGQKPVAGVHGIRAGDLRRRDDSRDVEIAPSRLGRTDADRFVGKARVQSVSIHLAVDRNRSKPTLSAGANHA